MVVGEQRAHTDEEGTQGEVADLQKWSGTGISWGEEHSVIEK